MADVGFSIKTDGDLVIASEKVFDKIGIDKAEAVRMFLRQTVEQQGIPFVMSRMSFNVTVDEELKAEAEDVFNQLGISLGDAIGLFLMRTVSNGKLPFLAAAEPKS